MNTHFEILPFPAEILESGAASADQGEQGERFSRGRGRSARPSAPRGGLGAGSSARRVYGKGGAAARPAGKMGKVGGVKPHYRPGGWLGGYGYWPAGVAVYEPDWLALADAPPGDPPGPGAVNGRDDGFDGNGGGDGSGFDDAGFSDSGENGLGGFSSAG